MIKLLACLSILFAAQVNGQIINDLELGREFTVVHAEKLIEQAHLNSRAKRSADDESNGYNDDAESANIINGFQRHSDASIQINDFATTGIKVSNRLLSAKLKTLAANPLEVLSKLNAPSKFCPFKKEIECSPEFPYRSLDGSCNNIENPWWGKAGTPFRRWMSADYSDEFKLNDPRVSIDGSELPNARALACNLNADKHEIEERVSHLFMQWGQLVNHDITSLSITREDDPDQSICRTCTRTQKCLPIMIESNTTCNCVKTMKHNCIEFTRSSASFGDVTCKLGQREQINMQTAFLDASHIYGTSSEENEKLRDKNGRGLMEVQQRSDNHNEDLLPASKKKRPSDCLDFRPDTKCFVSGDDRVNQNPVLMSMHTITVREHNRIARILAQRNPTWGDLTIFQETRRIVIAQIQHITYNEYLPILLGSQAMETFLLNSGTGSAKLKLYDPKFDPRVSNEYSASAGRFGHSMIRTDYSRLNSEYKSEAKSFALRNSYFRANEIYNKEEGGLESIIRGMLHDPLMAVDRWFSTEITQHLFETKNKKSQPFHFDLVAININRGRDHGIPSYVKFRDFCGLSPIKTWADMRLVLSNDVVDIYQQFFRHVEDVDLFVASVSEQKLDDALVGPTLACLLGIQYQATKFGDRFWYETAELPSDFTHGQLRELRKSSLSKLLCRNMNETPTIQPIAFLSANMEGNERVDCDSLPDFKWDFWTIP